MFRVTFFIEDGKLGEAFKRLTGLARNVDYNFVANLEDAPEPTPRKLAKLANGGLKMRAAESTELFVNALRERGMAKFQATDAREIMGSLGFAPTSYSHFITKAIKAGTLRRAAESTNSTQNVFYEVIEATEEE